MELTLKLNARFQPTDRFELEDALGEILEHNEKGEIAGGGTALSKDGEIEYCDIEITLKDAPGNVEWLAGLLNKIGIAKGSVLSGSDVKIPVGTLEGLAFYANGTDLPDEVYETCDINHVVEQMETAMEGIGRLYSHWQGQTETALYFYGTSFAEMQRSIEPFVASYPLCQESRIVQIA